MSDLIIQTAEALYYNSNDKNTFLMQFCLLFKQYTKDVEYTMQLYGNWSNVAFHTRVIKAQESILVAFPIDMDVHPTILEALNSTGTLSITIRLISINGLDGIWKKDIPLHHANTMKCSGPQPAQLLISDSVHQPLLATTQQPQVSMATTSEDTSASKRKRIDTDAVQNKTAKRMCELGCGQRAIGGTTCILCLHKAELETLDKSWQTYYAKEVQLKEQITKQAKEMFEKSANKLKMKETGLEDLKKNLAGQVKTLKEKIETAEHGL